MPKTASEFGCLNAVLKLHRFEGKVYKSNSAVYEFLSSRESNYRFTVCSKTACFNRTFDRKIAAVSSSRVYTIMFYSDFIVFIVCAA